MVGCQTQGAKTRFTKPDIKDDFCGPVMNYQYCKCAFHDEFCDAIGMDSNAADKYVREEYDKWVDEQREQFKQNCLAGGGIYTKDECVQCAESYHKEGDECVPNDEEEGDDKADEDTGFVPDGPLTKDCQIKTAEFNSSWKKYSDFDDAISYQSRSWEVQQNLNVHEKIITLRAEKFNLETDMELDRQLRLSMREYKTALVNNIRANLTKAFIRLSYITYTTIKAGKGAGDSYKTVLTSLNTVEKIGAALKVVQANVPKNSKLAIDTKDASGKVKSAGLNAALEAIESVGDPSKIVIQVMKDTQAAIVPSPDITPEEVEILRQQHLTNKVLDKALAASYKENAKRRVRALEIEAEIEELNAQAASWEAKEKERIKAMLIDSCQQQKKQYEEK